MRHRAGRSTAEILRGWLAMAGLSLALVAGCQSAPVVDEAPVAQDVSEEADLARLAPPSERYPDLFQRVALSGLVDPKDWVDAEPKAPTDMINAEFQTDIGDDALQVYAKYWEMLKSGR